MNAEISVKIVTDTTNHEKDNAKDIEKCTGHSTMSILTRNLNSCKKEKKENIT